MITLVHVTHFFQVIGLIAAVFGLLNDAPRLVTAGLILSLSCAVCRLETRRSDD